jgi:hypothetical protein
MMPVVLLRPPSALPGLHAEQFADAGAPLVGEGFAVDEHECGDRVASDQRAGHDRLAGSGWSDQYAGFLVGEGVEGLLLLRIEFCGELEGLRFAGGPFVGELQAAAGLFHEGCEPVLQPARQEEVAGECLVVVAQEARGVPGGGTAPLPLVEDRVGHRRRVLECGEQRWGQSCGFDRDSGTESGVHHGWRLHHDLRGGGGAEPVYLRADGDLAESLRQPVDLLGREPAEAGQVGPLVLVRLHSGQVEEHGGSAAAGAALQRRSDEIAEAADLDDVLGGEEPVVAGQVHPPAHGDRLAQQTGADLAGGGRGDGCGEEQPDMCAET